MSFICHIHNYTEYNQQWNVFSAFNPSKCTHTWNSGQPPLRCPGCSALLKGLTSVVDNSSRSRDSNPQPRVTSSTLYPLGHNCPLESLPVPPRFELRSLDSKSRVLTITPWNLHSMIEDRGNVIALSCVSNQASCRVCLFINDAVFLNQQIPPDVTVFFVSHSCDFISNIC